MYLYSIYRKNVTNNTTRDNDDNGAFHFKSDGRLIQFSDQERFINGQHKTVRLTDTVIFAIFGENQLRVIGKDFEEITYTIIKNDKTYLLIPYTDEN